MLHIELLAPIANGGKVEFPTTSSEPVVERWPKLRSQILSELGEEDWFCLQVVTKGYEESDSKVTVLVSVKDMFDSKWKEIKSRIRDILGDPEMGIDII